MFADSRFFGLHYTASPCAHSCHFALDCLEGQVFAGVISAFSIGALFPEYLGIDNDYGNDPKAITEFGHFQRFGTSLFLTIISVSLLNTVEVLSIPSGECQRVVLY